MVFFLYYSWIFFEPLLNLISIKNNLIFTKTHNFQNILYKILYYRLLLRYFTQMDI